MLRMPPGHSRGAHESGAQLPVNPAANTSASWATRAPEAVRQCPGAAARASRSAAAALAFEGSRRTAESKCWIAPSRLPRRASSSPRLKCVRASSGARSRARDNVALEASNRPARARALPSVAWGSSGRARATRSRYTNRLAPTVTCEECGPEVVSGIEILRMAAQGAHELRDGLIGPPRGEQCRAEIVAHRCVIRPRSYRRRQRLYRRLHASRRLERRTEVGECDEVARILPQACAHQRLLQRKALRCVSGKHLHPEVGHLSDERFPAPTRRGGVLGFRGLPPSYRTSSASTTPRPWLIHWCGES